MEDNSYIDSSFYDTETTHDPIWDAIKISAFEKRLINTPEFQRLRRIMQLGFVNLVYAASEHSRFVHSIGVCYHSKKLIDQVNENFKNQKRYRIWRKSGVDDTNNAPEYNDVKISYIEKIIISAAALLHDLPHAPFSHEIESPNDKPSTGIPNHDNFDKNPVFFKYLFDTENSRLAQVICSYNHEFWQLLQKDNWFKSISNENRKDYSDIFSPDGYVLINEKSIIQPEGEAKFSRLPILGVMIFELHLFEKPQDWVKYDEKENTFENAGAKIVETEWQDTNSNGKDKGKTKTGLKWLPISGWFRPYRKDIVGNTICADLIDYIERDGRQTGIISPIDLKFLDRMTITRAYPEKDKPTPLKIEWGNIPPYCEHIVFDIYDHKRGFIRESVITEILSCLQARYQLTERVYNHRVVEGARSMLQEISKLLCSAGVLNVKLLHSTSKNPEDEANCPTGDDTFLAWVMDTKERLKECKNDPVKKRKILAAATLAKALKERRVYREAVIIDGIHGYITGSSAGGENNCRALENILLSDNTEITDKRDKILNDISDLLKRAYQEAFDEGFNDYEQLTTIGARKVGKKYKIPRVLIAKPFSNVSGQNTSIDIQPLFVCEDPPHIKIQLDAMQTAYSSLWRVYLFIHPAFHWNHRINEKKTYINLHKEIEEVFLRYVNTGTHITWKNSIDYDQLLPSCPVDCIEFIEHYKKEEVEKRPQKGVDELLVESNEELQNILENLIDEIFKNVPKKDVILKELKDKECKELLDLVLSDPEMIKFIKTAKKREVLIGRLPASYIQLENRVEKGNEARILFNSIVKIMRDGKLF